jgi:hypothetical protein
VSLQISVKCPKFEHRGVAGPRQFRILQVPHALRDLRNVCAHHIDPQDFSSQKFKEKTKNIIKKSPLLWDVIRTKIGAKLFAENPPETVDSFVEAIGWREAFALFFALVVAHKEVCIARVSRINTLHELSP